MPRDPELGIASTRTMPGLYAFGEREPCLEPADFAYAEVKIAVLLPRSRKRFACAFRFAGSLGILLFSPEIILVFQRRDWVAARKEGFGGQALARLRSGRRSVPDRRGNGSQLSVGG
jgi:hypothetical protein